MRDKYNGVESIASPRARLFPYKGVNMIVNGFYFIKDEFFDIMKDPYLKDNKNSTRPFYYCFKEENTEIFWMIPLSSRVDKYKAIVEKRKQQNKRCDGIHILTFPTGRKQFYKRI